METREIRELTGLEAIAHAQAIGLTWVRKRADPIAGAARLVSLDEAWGICREDSGLIFLRVFVDP